MGKACCRFSFPHGSTRCFPVARILRKHSHLQPVRGDAVRHDCHENFRKFRGTTIRCEVFQGSDKIKICNPLRVYDPGDRGNSPTEKDPQELILYILLFFVLSNFIVKIVFELKFSTKLLIYSILNYRYRNLSNSLLIINKTKITNYSIKVFLHCLLLNLSHVCFFGVI